MQQHRTTKQEFTCCKTSHEQLMTIVVIQEDLFIFETDDLKFYLIAHFNQGNLDLILSCCCCCWCFVVVVVVGFLSAQKVHTSKHMRWWGLSVSLNEKTTFSNVHFKIKTGWLTFSDVLSINIFSFVIWYCEGTNCGKKY